VSDDVRQIDDLVDVGQQLLLLVHIELALCGLDASAPHILMGFLGMVHAAFSDCWVCRQTGTTPEKYLEIKAHPEIGYRILSFGLKEGDPNMPNAYCREMSLQGFHCLSFS